MHVSVNRSLSSVKQTTGPSKPWRSANSTNSDDEQEVDTNVCPAPRISGIPLHGVRKSTISNRGKQKVQAIVGFGANGARRRNKSILKNNSLHSGGGTVDHKTLRRIRK